MPRCDKGDDGVVPCRARIHGRDKAVVYLGQEAVFPFINFRALMLLGPEMKSTGEVMGIGDDFGVAFAKAQIAAGNKLPLSGRVFISVRDEDKAG